MFAIFGAFDVLAPFIADDVDLEPDLAPVRLQHFGHQLGIRVVGPLYRHGPQVDHGAFFDAGRLEQLFGFFGIVGGVSDGVVVRPLGGRHGVHGLLSRALIHRFENGVLVDGHVQRLTHRKLVERFVLNVVGNISKVEAGLFDDLDFRVCLKTGNVGRARIE